MAMYVNTNVSSLNAQRNLSKSTSALDTAYTRLASGLRINTGETHHQRSCCTCGADATGSVRSRCPDR